jgi:hypothetical protein
MNILKAYKHKQLFYILVLFLQLFSMTNAKASAYWIDVKGSGKIHEPMVLELCYGSMNERGTRIRNTGKELMLAGDFKFKIVDSSGGEKVLQLTLQKIAGRVFLYRQRLEFTVSLALMIHILW